MTANLQHFDTSRMRCRDLAYLSAADVEAITHVLPGILTPAVVQSLPPDFHKLDTVKKAKDLLQKLSSSSQVWVVSSKNSDEFIGLCFLHPIAQPQRPAQQWHVGYLFAQKVWGQGLATELLVAVIAFLKARQQHGLLVAGVEPSNQASSKVLLKVGFKPDTKSEPTSHYYRYTW